MFKTLKKRLKEQKGFTLIELLAVIVILGIIAAIAIPAISGIISNSKADAHIANGQQMISSVRLGVANGTYVPSTTADVPVQLGQIIADGYIEEITDPSGTTYSPTASIVTISEDASASGTFNYTVTLVAADGTTTYYDADPFTMERADVQNE